MSHLVVRLEFCTGRGDPEGDGFVTRRALCAQVGRMLDADMASDLGGELSLIVALGAPEGSKQMALLLVDEESLLDVHAVADIALSPLGFSLRLNGTDESRAQDLIYLSMSGTRVEYPLCAKCSPSNCATFPTLPASSEIV